MGLKQYSLVYKHFGIPIDKSRELDCLTFAMLLRDAMCIELALTPEGNEYLDTAYRITNTKPDIESLREKLS